MAGRPSANVWRFRSLMSRVVAQLVATRVSGVKRFSVLISACFNQLSVLWPVRGHPITIWEHGVGSSNLPIPTLSGFPANQKGW